MDKKLEELSGLLTKTLGESYSKVFKEAYSQEKSPLSEQAKIVQEIKLKKANRLMKDRKEITRTLNCTADFLKQKK